MIREGGRVPPFSPGSSITDSGDWTHKNDDDDDEEEEEVAVSWIFWGAAAFASLSRRAAASGVKEGG